MSKGVDRDEGHVFTVGTVVVLPPAAPGSSPVRAVTVPAHQVSGAPFPARPPSFGEEVNPPAQPVPTAPFVPGIKTPVATEAIPAPFGDPPAIVFAENNGLGINDATDNSIAEPSGASAGDVVFVSANSYAAYSTDGGSHFTKLNPTTIFPADIGFCCDQIVQYVPSIDRFIWLLQGPVAPGANQPHGYRLASASPAGIASSSGAAWTYWIATPNLFGCVGFDYPNLSVGSNYLYMSWDAEGGSCNSGLLV
ncbi:MAG TPA: hypothetical protein VLS25_01410, partial [Dehalococcoidia bacterium]|nr:hypothetical protein [Dehalococcoidia bacterium]